MAEPTYPSGHAEVTTLTTPTSPDAENTTRTHRRSVGFANPPEKTCDPASPGSSGRLRRSPHRRTSAAG